MTTWLLQSPRRLYGSLSAALVVFVVLAVLVVSVRLAGLREAVAEQAAAAPTSTAAPLLAPGDAALLEAPPTTDPGEAALAAVREAHPEVAPNGRTRVVASEGSVVVVDVFTDVGTASVTLVQDATSYVTSGIAWR